MAKRFMTALAIAAAVAFTATGCKQADGPLQDASAPDRIGDMSDIGKDLMAVQAKDPSGIADFVEDVTKLCGNKPAEAPTRELATRVANAVQSGGKLTMPDAVKLGTALWQTVAGREISQSQAEALRDEVKQLLTSAGVADASDVLEQMEVVQGLVNERPAKWYEFF